MSKHLRFLVIVVILALLGFVFYPMVVLPTKNYLYRVFIPLSGGLTNISDSVGHFFANISSIKNLSRENQELKEKNLSLESDLAKLQEVEHENQVLEEEFGFIKENHQYELIPAQIVGRSPTSYLQSFKVGKGSIDGIKKGQPVISHGFLIGVISEVTDKVSEVFLITNSNSLIPVVLQESRGTGLLQGGLQGLIVREIPVDTKVIAEENILTSGLGGDLPSGLPIGKVEKTISKESEIFQKAAALSPIDFNQLEIVFVMKE